MISPTKDSNSLKVGFKFNNRHFPRNSSVREEDERQIGRDPRVTLSLRQW